MAVVKGSTYPKLERPRLESWGRFFGGVGADGMAKKRVPNVTFS